MNVIKSIAIAAIATVSIASTAQAEKCGFLCKIAYGSGHETVAEAKAAWETKAKAAAQKQMDATGKSVAVIGNYVYVGAAGEVAQISKQEIAGKSKQQVKEIIIEAVTSEIAVAAIDGALEGAALEEATKAALVDAIKEGDKAAAESLLSDLGIDDPASLTGDEAEAILGADVKAAIINAAGSTGFDEAAAQAADEAADKAAHAAEEATKGIEVHFDQVFDDAVSAESIANGTAVDPTTGAPIN